MYERIPNLPVTNRPNSPDYVVERDYVGPDLFYFKFTVVGRGAFPLDMLRHDQVFPGGTPSAFALGHDGQREITLIRLTSDSHWLPTFDRWRSFGWFVKSDA